MTVQQVKQRVWKIKKELLDALKERGVMLQHQRGCTKKELQDVARHNGKYLCEIKKVIKSGWKGKPKGLLQVLGERGLIDRGILDKYTLLNGRKHPVSRSFMHNLPAKVSSTVGHTQNHSIDKCHYQGSMVEKTSSSLCGRAHFL
jgi:hypothetical protein